MKPRHLALLALVLLAAALRLPALLHDGLWRDEAYAYVDAVAPSFAEFLHRVTLTEWHPPLFFLLDYAWTRVAGTGEIALQALPYAFSLATVAMTYRLAKDAAGGSTAAGLLGAFLFAVAPLAVAYSNEYVYPLAAFTFSLAAWAVMRARHREPTPAASIGVACAVAACVYTHYVALLFVPMLLVWAALAPGGARRRLALCGAILAGALTFVLWLGVFMHQRAIGLPYNGAGTPELKAGFFVSTLLACVPALPPLLAFAVLLGIVALLVVALRRGTNRTDAAVLGAMFVAMLIAIDARDLMQIRYLYPLYPLFCAAVAVPVASLLTSRAAVAAAALAGAVVLAGDAAFAVSIASAPKSGIRALAAQRPPDAATLYVVAPDYLAATAAYYMRDAAPALYGFARDDRPEIFRLDGYAALWNDPGAVARAEAAIERAAKGKRAIVFIVDRYAANEGTIPYGKVWQLLERVRRRYASAGRSGYDGRYETVDAYRFRAGP